MALCLELHQMGFLTIVTIRLDRIKSCPLPCEKDLKKRGRGAHAYRTDLNSGMSVLRWYDNTCVQMCSNYFDPALTSTIKRYYQRYCSQTQIPKNKQTSLLKFAYQIASALYRAGTVLNQVGRPPKMYIFRA